MFSKALFKQSCKANGTMWGIITFAVCFMLACVMLISGNGNIGEVKNSIQDTIITKEIDVQLERLALSDYQEAEDGLEEFDLLFSANAKDTLSYLTWLSNMPNQTDFGDAAVYAAALEQWQSAAPQMETEAGRIYADTVAEWMEQTPQLEAYSGADEYQAAVQTWQEASPATQENAVAAAYAAACEQLQNALVQKAEDAGYDADSSEAQEMLGSVLYALNPNGIFQDFYTENGEEDPEDYEVRSLIAHIAAGDIDTYLSSDERRDYCQSRAEECIGFFLAGNMTKAENVDTLLQKLSDYGVNKEKYDSFGYTYDSVKHMANTAMVTYHGRLEYELDQLAEQYADGQFQNEGAYFDAIAATKETLADDLSASFLSTLPQEVSDALEEIGQADLYTLIVGSIFYKLAGLLLPIIYMIMASNNLISGQVDSGSMAYILATSTKRRTVVWTQAVYLIGSLFAMFALTTTTSCICLSLVTEEVELTYSNLILLNIGAFLVLLALSGLCFLTSCVFDRSKRSMAIGECFSIHQRHHILQRAFKRSWKSVFSWKRQTETAGKEHGVAIAEPRRGTVYRRNIFRKQSP